MKKEGRVILVGCGPGDPGLLTINGQEAIRHADVLIYDRLVNKRVLADMKPGSKIIYVGKESSHHTMPQEGINQVMVDMARQGNNVVRLKGGDPFVFGRGGEEAQFLKENGIDFEIIPGVTSAIGAPAYAGIPVTHRDYTSTLSIITGHEKPGKNQTSIPWERIANSGGTLVFLMGMENLSFITERLMAEGCSKDTPVALIRWGTLPQQAVLTGNISDIVERVKEVNFQPPAVIVIGVVVNLREELRWFDNRPLFGMRIVVTRSRAQSSRLIRELETLGAQVLEFPTIALKPIDDPNIKDNLNQLSSYSWLIFTSVNGVNEFLRQVWEKGYDIRDLKGPRICAIGPATAAALAEKGIRVDVVPPEYRAEAVVEALTGRLSSGDKVLIPRAKNAREVLPVRLEKLGARVDELIIYEATTENIIDDEDYQSVKTGEFDMITFTSSSTVKNFVRMLGQEVVDSLKGRIRTACIGPITAASVREAGLDVDIVADEYTIDGLVQALIEEMAVNK
ncbi:MAG: uroporphyrinogen-III C-methyltransferase [Chitinophagales bacterium]